MCSCFLDRLDIAEHRSELHFRIHEVSRPGPDHCHDWQGTVLNDLPYEAHRGSQAAKFDCRAELDTACARSLGRDRIADRANDNFDQHYEETVAFAAALVFACARAAAFRSSGVIESLR